MSMIVHTVKTVVSCAGPACRGTGALGWIEGHPALAGYIQAVLSPLAIVGTLAAALLPERLRRSAEQRRLIRHARAVAEDAYAGVHLAAEGARTADGFLHPGGIPRSLTATPLTALQQLPILQIDNFRISGPLRDLLSILTLADDIVAHPSGLRSFGTEQQVALAALKGQAKVAADRVRHAVNRQDRRWSRLRHRIARRLGLRPIGANAARPRVEDEDGQHAPLGPKKREAPSRSDSGASI